jgi:hypothetical protein
MPLRSWWLAERQLQRGAALFAGDQGISARLVGHEVELPTQASRCINCHELTERAPAVSKESAIAAPSIYASELTHAALTEPRVRRGGPASVFDADSLCSLLRTGVDPASIIISTTMPRYRISDAQCADLWTYLQHR